MKDSVEPNKITDFRAIFGPSGNFKSRVLISETSDYEFRDLLNELFQTAKKIKKKK